MSVIQNNNNNNIKLKNNKKNNIYEIPAVLREDKSEISFEKALIAAIIFHPVLIAFILFMSFLLKLLGLDFDMLKKPDLRPKDLEFVLVEKEATPIDKNTKNRSDRNSRAGGKHDPKRNVSIPQPPAPKANDKKPAAPKSQPKPPVKQQPKVPPQPKTQPAQTKPQAQPKPQPAQPKPQQPVQMPKVEQPKPKAPAPKPTPAPVAPKPVSVPKSNFNIPIPPTSIPKMTQPITAPVTASPSTSTSSASSAVKSSTPAPSFSPTAPGRKSDGYGGTNPGEGRFSKQDGTSGDTNGNVGNPGPGNPKGAPGIDAIKEPDFGPYMKELQRRIKMNWDPPKGNESKRVILLFKISRDGRLLSVNVHKSSGLPEADNAAINAVKLTAPFKPLPPDFKGSSVDIQFTFDYNVLGASMY